MKSLNIAENNALLNRTHDLTNPVDIALKKFKNHPSIIDIKEKITVEAKFSFSFSKVAISEIITEAYAFDKSALAILLSYLSNHWQRTKINTSFSTWSEILSSVPQGSILGPLLFNIYINDLFYQFINTNTCNFADDTTLSAFGTNLEDLLYNLEYGTQSAIMWFDNNYMKLNQDKCHFLISGNVTEHLWAIVDDELIWESAEEKLLEVTIDKNLNFNSHLNTLCKKVGQKVSALARIVKILSFHHRSIILKTFIE